MCDERRATVTTTNLKGPRPRGAVSLTLTRTQIYVGIAAQTVGVLAAAVAVALFLGRIMVHQEFDVLIGEFHTVAKPQVERMMDTKILQHHRQVEGPYRDDMEEVLQRLAVLEKHTEDMDERNHARLTKIEKKLDRLLAR